MRGGESSSLVRIVGQTTRSDNLEILAGCFVMAGDTAALDDFAERVVPELQRREPFRKECAATTLREHLGLPRPKNRFFPRQDLCAERP